MQHRNISFAGQVYGQIVHVDTQNNEIVLFIKKSDNETLRCCVVGPVVKKLIEEKKLSTRNTVSASGEYYVRSRGLANALDVELVLTAHYMRAEPKPVVRVRGSCHINMKGVVMYWDTKTYQMKTFANYSKPGMPPKMVASIFMRHWVDNMSEGGRHRFIESMKKPGREFTVTGTTKISAYKDKNGVVVPVLLVLPLDFCLQS